MPSPASDPQRSFLTDVAALYRLMGFVVEADSNDSSVDFFLFHTIPGVTTAKYAVHCVLTAQDVVPSEKLQHLIDPFARMIKEGAVRAGVIVSNGRFPPEAKMEAEKLQISCVTFSDVLSQAFDAKTYLNALIADNETDQRTGKLLFQLSAREGNQDSKPILAEPLIARWIQEPNAQVLLIVGEPGSGKTELCRQIEYTLAKSYLKDPIRQRLPLRITSSARDNQLVLEGIVHRKFPEPVDSSTIIRTLSSCGTVVLFCDGIDELEPETRKALWYHIEDLSRPPQAKLILTQRPSNLDLDLGAPGRTKLLRLCPLDPQHVAAAVARSPLVDQAMKDAFQRIFATDRINELLRSPLLAGLLLDVLRTAVPIGDVAPARFVDEMISLLTQAWDRAHRPPAARVDLAALARRLFLTQQMVLSAESESEQLYFSHSPLFEQSPDGWMFRHKSVQDFLVSREIVREIDARTSDLLKARLVPREILRFIADFGPDPNRLDELSCWLKTMPASGETRSGVFGSNVEAIYKLLNAKQREHVPRMFVRQLRLQNVKCFKDVVFKFSGPRVDSAALNVLVGENGIGKSTVLQAIALCSLGPDLASKLVARPDLLLRDGEKLGFLSAEFDVEGLAPDQNTVVTVTLGISANDRRFILVESGDAASANTDALLRARSTVDFFGLFVAGYGPWRHFDLAEDTSISTSEDPLSDRVQSLFDPRKLLFSPRGLSRLLLGDGSPFVELGAPLTLPDGLRARIVKILVSLLPDDDTERFTAEGAYRSDFGLSSFGQLSDGYRSTLAWAAHLVVNLAATAKWSEDISHVGGIVLFDELDLHLHPKWQRTILERIRRTFPQLQFVATTHSPLVVADVNTNQGELTLLIRNENTVTTHTEFPTLHGMSADQLLASEVFGFIIDRDPSTERLLREASILAGKGQNRSPAENVRYEELVREVKMVMRADGRSQVERDIEDEEDRQLSERIKALEAKRREEPTA